MNKIIKSIWTISEIIFSVLGLVTALVFTILVTFYPNLIDTVILHTLMMLTASTLFALSIMINRPEKNNPVVKSAYDFIEQRSFFIRTNQTIELTLDLIEKDNSKYIEITGIHLYTVYSPNTSKPSDFFVYYRPELGKQSKANNGGFKRVLIGNKSCKKDINFSKFLSTKKHEIAFKYVDTIEPNNSLDFEFHTCGVYELKGRVTWAILDLCDGLILRIKNQTGLSGGKLEYSVNHHKKEEIESKIKSCVMNDEICFNHPIFPYQGFEISWDFTESRWLHHDTIGTRSDIAAVNAAMANSQSED
ncbi:MAG: hypothetical protein FWC70_10450 [Defluviitaleaceae bacterium]|nr:hypothetical protein [Defluviitaleaceae bacterium]